ncbi:MAG: ATP-binding protein [Candidatus Saccharimonadaceae bacterium]
MVAVLVIGLYVASFLTNLKQTNPNLIISDSDLFIAAVVFIVSLASYIWAPKKFIGAASAMAYAMLIALVALIIYSTGGTTSPFITLWVLLSIFSGIFGWYGIISILMISNSYLGWLIYTGTDVVGILPAILLVGELPILISFLLWYNKGGKINDNDEEARSYHELAHELSQVAGKSEVVINAISDGVIAVSSQGTIELINPAAQRIIGWGKQDALGLSYKSVLKLIDDKDQELDPGQNPVEKVLGTNKEIKTEGYRIETSSGKKILITLTISPVGQVGSGAIMTFRDITSERAEERQQAEFISTASHEMRTPVASIEGYLGLVLNPATATIDDKAREFITKAHASAQHLGRLFQDLLDVSKSEDGRLQNNPKVVDLVPFVNDVVDGLQPKAREKGLRMIFKPDIDLSDGTTRTHRDRALASRRINPVYYVDVDNDHLREVVANLVENAIKYTPKGDVVIDINGDSDHAIISVQDSGIGIPLEDQSHLFQKFYRVDNSDTREIGGTGLGLYLCRRLVETMGGKISLQSEYRKGSTFSVDLPRMDHMAAMQRIEETANQLSEQPERPTSPAIVLDAAQTAIADSTLPVPTRPATIMAGTSQPTALADAAPVRTAPGTAPTYNSAERPNTPLSSIEQNPSRYLSRSDQINIPPRTQ